MRQQLLILGALGCGLAAIAPSQSAPLAPRASIASAKYLPRPASSSGLATPACRARTRSAGSSRRGVVGSVRLALRDLGSASWAMCSLRAGGGTAWSQFARDAAADREQFLSNLSATLSRSGGGSAEARRQSRVLLDRARRDLVHLQQQQSRVEGNGIISAFEARARYRRNWLQARSAIARLSRLASAMPDDAALQVARRTFQEIHDAASAENR